jgi:hypothetical protein
MPETKPLTADQERELREASQRATERPWGVYVELTPTLEDARRELSQLVDGTPEFSGSVVMISANGLAPAVTGCGATSEINAHFIVAAVNLMPAALAAIDALRADCAALLDGIREISELANCEDEKASVATLLCRIDGVARLLLIAPNPGQALLDELKQAKDKAHTLLCTIRELRTLNVGRVNLGRLQDAESKRDTLAAENARLQIEVETYKAVADNWMNECHSERDRRVAAQEAITMKWEPENARLRAQLEDMNAYVAEIGRTNFPGEEGLLAVKVKQLRERLEAAEKAGLSLYQHMGGHNHWDSQGNHGATCPQCEYQRIGREAWLDYQTKYAAKEKGGSE